MPDPQNGPMDEAADARASAAILAALRQRRASLGGEAGSPVDDGRLSERILSEARVRSARIAGSAVGAGPSDRSARVAAPGRPIPWWLWLAWLAALAGAALAWWLLA